jgi:hypothetical protein
MTTWQPTTPEHPPTAESDLDLGMLESIESAPPLPGRERVTSNFTFVLLGLFALLGSFTLGAWFQREHGPATSTATAAGAALPGAASGATLPGAASGATIPSGSRGAGQGAAGLGAGGQFAGGGGTVGTVKLVDGTNVYITDANGNLVKVTTQPGLVVTVNKDGTVADLAAGETVVVTGTAGADGSIAATAIRSGTALAGLGGQGRGGTGAGANGTGAAAAPTTSR